jgi:hypothetical protein
MQMRYGLNEADSWWFFSQGPNRQRIQNRIRSLRPQLIRAFVFDKGTPDPISDWPVFRSYLQAIIDVGAKPVVTFAKCSRPFRDPRAVRWFASQCGDVVWTCLEEWGPEVVRDWYWIVWNEPNSTWIGGGLTFEEYIQVFNEVAYTIRPWLDPHLGGKPLPIGGPSIEGFDPFWLDWVWRFVDEVHPSLYSFVNWHCYADWRSYGEEGAPGPLEFARLMTAKVEQYGDRARDVARIILGLPLMNVCGEWNVHSHYEPAVRARFNQTIFGAAFGGAILLQLLGAGVDAEMFWSGTDEGCGYGLIDKDGAVTPLYHVKRLFAHYVSFGDWVSFPEVDDTDGLFGLYSRSGGGRRSLLLVNTVDEPRSIDLSRIDADLDCCDRLLRIDGSTAGTLLQASCTGSVPFSGWGVAAVTDRDELSDDNGAW